MIRIRRQSVWCYVDVERSDTRAVKWLHMALTVSTQAYVRGKLEFYKLRLFDLRRKRFPAGLLGIAYKKLRRRDYDVQIVDERPDPPKIKPLPKSCAHLYSYQKSAINACLKRRNGIVKIATGGGKTEVAVGLATRVNCPVLFLVDERGLALQAMQRWTKITGKPAGIIGEGRFEPNWEFTVATLQTLQRRLKRADPELVSYLLEVGCLIVDEAHILGAKTYYRTVMSIPNAYYRIGLSATPTGRSDQRDAYVVGAIGPVVYRASIEKLVKEKKLAKALVLFYRYPGALNLEDYSAKWHQLYLIGMVREAARNRALVRICMVTPKPILVFFDRKAHGWMLKDLLEEQGFSVEIVYGIHKGEERMKLARRLGSGELDVLLASKVFNKGVDIPEIRSAVNAAGYKAAITSMQKLGRPMRTAEGKVQFVYWDTVDDHHPTLLRHSRYRARIYKREGLELRLVDSLKEAVEILGEVGMIYKVPWYAPRDWLDLTYEEFEHELGTVAKGKGGEENASGEHRRDTLPDFLDFQGMRCGARTDKSQSRFSRGSERQRSYRSELETDTLGRASKTRQSQSGYRTGVKAF